MDITKFTIEIALIFLTICANYVLPMHENLDAYMRLRNSLFSEENSTRTGFGIHLSAKEMVVNKHLMELKQKEISFGLENGTYYPSLHFFHAKQYIQKSEIFNIIKTLPKGIIVYSVWVCEHICMHAHVCERKMLCLRASMCCVSVCVCECVLYVSVYYSIHHGTESDLDHVDQSIDLLQTS